MSHSAPAYTVIGDDQIDGQGENRPDAPVGETEPWHSRRVGAQPQDGRQAHDAPQGRAWRCHYNLKSSQSHTESKHEKFSPRLKTRPQAICNLRTRSMHADASSTRTQALSVHDCGGDPRVEADSMFYRTTFPGIPPHPRERETCYPQILSHLGEGTSRVDRAR